MYRKANQPELSCENFELPFSGKLSPDNRWLIMVELIPWSEEGRRRCATRADGAEGARLATAEGSAGSPSFSKSSERCTPNAFGVVPSRRVLVWKKLGLPPNLFRLKRRGLYLKELSTKGFITFWRGRCLGEPQAFMNPVHLLITPSAFRGGSLGQKD